MGRLVDAALRFPGLVLAFALGLLGVGLYCYTQLDVEAYPNPVAPMIEVITQPQGLSAEEVERYVTLPLEAGLAGMIDLEHVPLAPGATHEDLAFGEDFELLAATANPCGFPVIGGCEAGSGVEIRHDGQAVRLSGWEHFRLRETR